MYWTWMQENNKSALEASQHFNVSIEEVWEQVNQAKNTKE